jgi:hypothetical protein
MSVSTASDSWSDCHGAALLKTYSGGCSRCRKGQQADLRMRYATFKCAQECLKTCAIRSSMVRIHLGKPSDLSGALMILQKPYMRLTKMKTTSICPSHSGKDLSVSSTSLLAMEDWSGKVVP